MHTRLIVLAALSLLFSVRAAEPVSRVSSSPSAEKLGWRLAVQAYSFNRFTFFEAVDKAASLGLTYIEAYPGQRLSPELPDVKTTPNMSPEHCELMLKKCSEAGVKLVNYGVVGLSNNEGQCRKVFEFAKRMGIETIVSEPPQEALPLIARLCNEYGINVALHNHPKPSRYWDPQTVVDACRDLDVRVGACADTGHWMRSEIKPIDALRLLEGRIVSFHFKDLNRFGKGAHDVHWGTGGADVPALLAELKRQNVKAVFSIEYEHNWENSVPDMAACIAFFERTAAALLNPQTAP